MEFLLDGHFWGELWWGLFSLLRKVFFVLVPVVFTLEVLHATRLFPWLVERVYRFTRWLGFEKESLMPLLTGFVFGILLGAGVLISEAKANAQSRRQALLVGAFLGICHAVIEDTLIFVAVGASGLVILATRIPAAFIIVFIISWILRSRLSDSRMHA